MGCDFEGRLNQSVSETREAKCGGRDRTSYLECIRCGYSHRNFSVILCTKNMSLQVSNCGSNDTQDGYISPSFIFSEHICLHFTNSALLKKNETTSNTNTHLNNDCVDSGS